MANRYIIFTNDIHMIGGGQKYTANKLKYVSNSGWIPSLIYYDSARESKIYISNLKDYENNYVKEMRFPPGFYTNKKVDSIVNEISALIEFCKGDNIIIESSTITAALWGELYAARTRGSHIAYILNEHFYANDDERNFLYYKYQNNKLFGTGPQSIKLIFKDTEKYPIYSDNYFTAFGGDGVTSHNVDFPINLDHYSKKICIFGRVDKHFVIQIVREIKAYCNKYENEKFLVVIVGGSDRKSELEIFYQLFSKCVNTDFYCTGPVFPLPRNWITEMDVTIATAGAAILSAQLGCPTISICVQNNKPFGIVGYTTSLVRDMEEDTKFEASLSELLDMVLIGRYCKTHALKYEYFSKYNYNTEDEKEEFDKQILLAQKTDNNYYDMDLIHYTAVEKVKNKIFGFYLLRMLWHRIKLLSW